MSHTEIGIPYNRKLDPNDADIIGCVIANQLLKHNRVVIVIREEQEKPLEPIFIKLTIDPNMETEQLRSCFQQLQQKASRPVRVLVEAIERKE